MTLKELSEQFNFQDILPLVEEYYPTKVRHVEYYVQMFNTIDESEFDQDVFDQAYRVKLSKVRVKSVDGDGTYHTIRQAHLYSKNGFIESHPSFDQCIFSKIDYMTMEMYSDEEIFIRCLHGLFLKNFAKKICEKPESKKKNISDTKKNDKGN
jgi:hypothetical protein